MRMKNIWIAVIVASLAAVLGSACRLGFAGPPAQKESPEPKQADAEKRLKQAMLEDAQNVYELNSMRYKTGGGLLDVEAMYNWSSRWLEAEFDLAVEATTKATALKAHLSRMKDVEKLAIALAKSGQGREAEAVAGRYFRTQAELWLVRGRTR